MTPASLTAGPAYPTLVDLLPARTASTRLTRDLFAIICGSALVAASAQMAIPLPFTPVPITGQTFAVLLVGMALGARRGALAMLLYLLEGAAGLPVFAGGALGIAKLMGPTAGYLWACPLAAACAGYLASRGWDRRPATTVAAMLLSSSLILLSGAFWLQFYVGGLASAFARGVLPFLIGDVVKASLAAAALPIVWKQLDRDKAGS